MRHPDVRPPSKRLATMLDDYFAPVNNFGLNQNVSSPGHMYQWHVKCGSFDPDHYNYIWKGIDKAEHDKRIAEIIDAIRHLDNIGWESWESVPKQYATRRLIMNSVMSNELLCEIILERIKDTTLNDLKTVQPLLHILPATERKIPKEPEYDGLPYWRYTR